MGADMEQAASEIKRLKACINDQQVSQRTRELVAEERRQADQRQIQRIINAMSQHIVVLGPDGATLYVNQAVLEYAGLSMEEVQATDFRARVFHPDDVERLRDERQKALTRGVTFETEQRARRKDGQYRWFLIQYNPLRDEEGRIICWFATGTDIE
jgi:formate hydrogenlyase transcriptional activator